MRWPVLVAAAVILSGCPQPVDPLELEGDDAGPADGASGRDRPRVDCSADFRSPVRVPPPPGEAAFSEIRSVDVDADGRLFVLSGGGGGHVTVLAPPPGHALVRSFAHGELGYARDLAVAGDGRVFVVEFDRPGDTPRVAVFGPDGALERRFDVTGPNDENDEAYSLTLDGAGRLYLGGWVLFVFETDGTYVRHIGAPGDAPGRVLLPMDVALGPDGRLYAADLYRNRVTVWSPDDGQPVREMGGRGSGPGQFDGDAEMGVHWGPTHLAFDASGDLYVNDPWHSRVQKLDPLGGFLAEHGFGGSREVGPLAVHPDTGNLYIARADTLEVVCPL